MSESGGETRIAGRRRLSADARKNEIAAVARDLFGANGYHATTTRELARAAGVSDALLYRHFADKAALLDFVITKAIQSLGTSAPLERLAEVPTRPLLLRIGGEFLTRVESNLDLIRLLISEQAGLDDSRFAAFIDSAASGLGTDLERRGIAPTADAGYLVARSFFGSLISFVILQRLLGMDAVRTVDPRAYLEYLVDQLVAR